MANQRPAAKMLRGLLLLPAISILFAESSDQAFPCRDERSSIWGADSPIDRERAVSAYQQCLAEKRPLLVCDSAHAWCADSDVEEISDCSEDGYPTRLTFDFRSNLVRLDGDIDYLTGQAELTKFEVARTGNEIYHYRTDYIRGVSSVAFSRDMKAVWRHTATLNTEDGFGRIIGGGWKSCKALSVDAAD